MNYNFKLGLDFSKQLDREDELKDFKSRFYVQPDEIYMDGNSLGMCSKDAEEALLNVLNVWKKEGILIWNVDNNKYYHYSRHLAKMMAPLINANADEVVIAGSTTSNIHQAIASFYKPTKERYKILVDDLNFPTDRYAIDSMVKLKGYTVDQAVKIVKSSDGRFIDEDAVIAAMTDDVAIVHLPSVLYRSCQLLDMKRITEEAHKRGIFIGWDLCHSIGAVHHDFNVIQPDYAVWCNYKHLSGGPGAIGGLYINRKHFAEGPGLAGWFGNKDATQFQLLHTFEHEPDASGFQVGTPSLLSMAPLEGALKIFNDAGMDKVRKKSLQITAYLMYLIDEKLSEFGYSIGNPREDKNRGGHVCLEHDDAYRISLALKRYKIIPDFREPNVIRLAPIALYTSYEEVYKLIEALEEIVVKKVYEEFSAERGLVV